MEIARISLSILLALLLLVTGGGKVLRLTFSHRNRDELGVGPRFWIVTGVLEVAATAGLVGGIWFVPLSIAAASGVMVLMIGAIVVRFRTGHAQVRRGAVVDVVILLIGAVIVTLGFLAIAGG